MTAIQSESHRSALWPSRTVRRIFYVIAAVLAALLCFFPRPYVARVKILPQEANSGTGAQAMIAALGGGAQNFAAVLSGQKTNYLVIGRSHDVQTAVISRLKLIGRKGFRESDQAQIRLARKVDLQILAGGVLEITAKDTDPAFAQELVNGYTVVLQDRLARLGLEQTAHKKSIVLNRMRNAIASLAAAQEVLRQYRGANNLVAPETEFATALNRKITLETYLRSKQIELQTAREFNTDQSMRVKEILAEINTARQKLAEEAKSGYSVNAETLQQKSTEYVRLSQEVYFWQSLVEVYRRFAEEASIEEVSAGTNIQIVETPHIDPKRQFNLPAVGLLLLVLLIVAYTEYYMPLTGLGRRRPRR
jgi:capsule polysaccharide export protein KpsE/RkpR